jgi:hypothetical protein
VTLYSMLKIWLEAFWKPHPDSAWHAPVRDRLLPAHTALGGLVVLIVSFGLLPESVDRLRHGRRRQPAWSKLMSRVAALLRLALRFIAHCVLSGWRPRASSCAERRRAPGWCACASRR